jgi:ACS family hexuronate transporter-like MFS transporter
LFSLLWVVLWAIFGKDRPEKHRLMTSQELREIQADEPQVSANAGLSLRSALFRPAILATAFAFFGYSYILYFFLSWFPTYLATAQHLSIQNMSLVSAIPWALGFVGLASGGLVSDHVFRSTGNALFARKLVLVTSLVIAAVCVALAGVASSVGTAVTLMGICVFSMYLSGSLYFALVLDLTEAARVGSVMGFVHFVANCAGIVAPMITGFIVQSSGGFTGAFVLAGGIAVAGALAVAFVVRSPSPVQDNCATLRTAA